MAIDDNVVRLLQEHRNVLPVLILNKVVSCPSIILYIRQVRIQMLLCVSRLTL